MKTKHKKDTSKKPSSDKNCRCGFKKHGGNHEQGEHHSKGRIK